MNEPIVVQLQVELRQAQELSAHLSRENHFLSEENNKLVADYNGLVKLLNNIMAVFSDCLPEVDKLRKIKRLIHDAKNP